MEEQYLDPLRRRRGLARLIMAFALTVWTMSRLLRCSGQQDGGTLIQEDEEDEEIVALAS